MDTYTTLICFTAFSCVFWRVVAQENRITRASSTFSEKEILDMLLDSYDNKLRPKSTVNGTAGPTVVRVNFLIRSIAKVDDWNMELSTQLTFRLEWNDARLAFDDGNTHEYLVLTDPYRIWMPDLFFQNEISAHLHNILTPNMFLRIHANGNVLMSIRLSVTLGCPMDLRLFPMDRQLCEIRMASYGYTEKDIVLEWKTDPTNPAYKPVQTYNFAMPRFDLQKVSTGHCSSKTVTGSYSCLRAALFLQREFSYYLVHVYVPTFMLVCLSWIPFWLDREATVARVLLGVTALISMLSIQSGINGQVSPVSYTKAIDVWIGFCLALIFGTLLESASVNHCTHKDESRQRKQGAKNKRNNSEDMDGEKFHQASYQKVTTGIRSDTELHDGERDSFFYTEKSSHPQRLANRLNPGGDNQTGDYYNHDPKADTANAHPPTIASQPGGVTSINFHGNPSSDILRGKNAQSEQRSFLGLRIPSKNSKRLDFFSRLMFPGIFLAFNLVYWGLY